MEAFIEQTGRSGLYEWAKRKSGGTIVEVITKTSVYLGYLLFQSDRMVRIATAIPTRSFDAFGWGGFASQVLRIPMNQIVSVTTRS
jgi:uncharacterized protein (UPF0303 family)